MLKLNGKLHSLKIGYVSRRKERTAKTEEKEEIEVTNKLRDIIKQSVAKIVSMSDLYWKKFAINRYIKKNQIFAVILTCGFIKFKNYQLKVVILREYT